MSSRLILVSVLSQEKYWQSEAGMVLPGSHALGKPVIRQNFNGSYGSYERPGISEGILKQTCFELYTMFFACSRNVSPCKLQNNLVDGCSGKMVLGKAVSVAGSFQGWVCIFCLWRQPGSRVVLLSCERKGCTSHYPLSFWMEPSLDLWLKSWVLARGQRKVNDHWGDK